MVMTPAEIAQTRRILHTAQRDLLHYRQRAVLYINRNQEPPGNLQMSILDNERTIERLERELIDAGVEVE